MLLIKKLQDDKSILTHYVLISDLSKPLYKQSKADRRLYYCRRCLQHFRAQEKLDDHAKYCNKIGAQKTIFPDDDNNFVKLKNYRYEIPAPFALYADCEAINAKK